MKRRFFLWTRTPSAFAAIQANLNAIQTVSLVLWMKEFLKGADGQNQRWFRRLCKSSQFFSHSQMTVWVMEVGLVVCPCSQVSYGGKGGSSKGTDGSPRITTLSSVPNCFVSFMWLIRPNLSWNQQISTGWFSLRHEWILTLQCDLPESSHEREMELSCEDYVLKFTRPQYTTFGFLHSKQ